MKVPVSEPFIITGLDLLCCGDNWGDGQGFPHAAQSPAEGWSGRRTHKGGTERSGRVSAWEIISWKEKNRVGKKIIITRGQGSFSSDFTLYGACFVSLGTCVLLVRAVVSVVGPGVGHRKGWVGMTAGQCWCKNASRESSQRIGGQQERTACVRVGGQGKCALNTGVPRQRSSLGCHFRKGWSKVREQGCSGEDLWFVTGLWQVEL